MPRHKAEPRKLGATDRNNEYEAILLAKHDAVVANMSRLDQAVLEADREDDILEEDDRMSDGLGALFSEEEDDDHDEDDEEEDDEEEDVEEEVIIFKSTRSRTGGAAAAASSSRRRSSIAGEGSGGTKRKRGASSSQKKRRKRQKGGRERKKKRRRLLREGRRMIVDDDDDEGGINDLGIVDTKTVKSFSMQMWMPMNVEPALRGLLVKRSSFVVDQASVCALKPMQLMLMPPTSRRSPGRRILRFCLQDDLRVAALEKYAAEAFGIEVEAFLTLQDMCEMAPPFAYYEAKSDGQAIHLDVYLTEYALQFTDESIEPPVKKDKLKNLRRLMEWFYPHQIPPISSYYGQGGGGAREVSPTAAGGAALARAPFDPADLYRCLEEYKALNMRRSQAFHRRGGLPSPSSSTGGEGVEESKGPEPSPPARGERVPGMLVDLRPYQTDAVEWMISREKGQSFFASTIGERPLPHGWVEISRPGIRFLYNPIVVNFQEEAPDPWNIDEIRGGILADEMGLGKTIEVMALVLKHPYQPLEHLKEEEEDDVVDDQRDAMREDEEEKQDEDYVCPCGKSIKWSGGGVQCDQCHEWSHFGCAGFASQGEAEAFEPFVCEVCHGIRRKRRPKAARATLIVCPQLILGQWAEEIKNRTDKHLLSVKIYRGVAECRRPEDRPLLNPDYLGSHDVILTTFDALSRDLAHTHSAFVPDIGEKARPLRGKKRYRVTPSPLVGLKWWRVCLDEAQMIESSTAAAAQMALNLKTVHRWCVSGTPIWKGQSQDLYGLMLFLQASPYDSKNWWRHAIEIPHERGDPDAASRLHSLLAGLMWRTSKKSVKDQLALPPQDEITRHLTFSGVERHFYRIQHDYCASAINDAVRKVKAEAGAAARRKEGIDSQKGLAAVNALERCAGPLLRLRQACCHPQVGAGGLKSSGPARIMTMDEIHEKLIEDCRLKCEESQRLMLMQLCGLAAVQRMQAQLASEASSGNSLLGHDRFLAEAAHIYEKALLVAEGNRQPLSITGIGDMKGAPRFKSSLQETHGSCLVTFQWTQAADGGGGAAQGDIWKASESSPLWAKVGFVTGKKVMGLKIWPVTTVAGERNGSSSSLPPSMYLPGRCRLMASHNSEGTVFVEAASFDVNQLPLMTEEGGNGRGGAAAASSSSSSSSSSGTPRIISGFHMYSAKTWKLEVMSVAASSAAAAGGRKGVPSSSMVGFKVEFIEAEVDVDPLQVLHVVTNLKDVFKAMEEAKQGQGKKKQSPSSGKVIEIIADDGDEREEGGGGGGGASSAAAAGSSSAFSSSSPASSDKTITTALTSAAGPGPTLATVGEYSKMEHVAISQRIPWLEEREERVRRRESNLCRLIHRGHKQNYDSAERGVDDLWEQVKQKAEDGGRRGMHWWEWALGQLAGNSRAFDPHSELLRRFQLSSSANGFPHFYDYRGLLAAVKIRYDDLVAARKDLNKKLKLLNENPSADEIKKNASCGECKKDWGKSGPQCSICKLDKVINAYDRKLASYRRQGTHQGLRAGGGLLRGMMNDEDGVVMDKGEVVEIHSTKQTNAFREPCELHRILYSVLIGWLRAETHKRKGDEEWELALEEANLDSKTPQVLEMERKLGQKFWNAHYDLLNKLDEISAAATRLELAGENENALHMSEDRRKVVVFRHEISTKRQELQHEITIYETELNKQKKQLKYLKNMAQQQETHPKPSREGGSGSGAEDMEVEEEEDCKICLLPLGRKPRTVLPCAHYFCHDCIKHMLGQKSHHVCPICREKYQKKDMKEGEVLEPEEKEERRRQKEASRKLDEEGKEEDQEESEVDVSDVRGSWGTKVTAMVAEVLRLPPEDKCLIFSEWDEMLDVVQAALNDNAVRCVRLKGEKSADNIRAAFRQEADLRCMLLNLKSGAKGLTLVEANHVFLLEPVFNAANEAQAINRVYRIGQTKRSVVHRFIVRGTIEERVEEMRRRKLEAAGGEDSILSSAKKGPKKGDTGVTLDEMQTLFLPEDEDGEEEEGRGEGEGGGRRKGGGGRGGSGRSAAAAAVLEPVVVGSDEEEEVGGGGGAGGGRRLGGSSHGRRRSRLLDRLDDGWLGSPSREGEGGGGGGEDAEEGMEGPRRSSRGLFDGEE